MQVADVMFMLNQPRLQMLSHHLSCIRCCLLDGKLGFGGLCSDGADLLVATAQVVVDERLSCYYVWGFP